MKKISSELTGLHKTVFPVLIVGVSILVLVVLVGVMIRDREINYVAIGFILLAAVYAYSEAKKRSIDLADEVWDDGEYLTVKNHGKEERIAITNIQKLKYGGIGNTHFVTLILREPSGFGSEIKFVPPRKLFQLFKNPMIVDLAIRIKNAAGMIE